MCHATLHTRLHVMESSLGSHVCVSDRIPERHLQVLGQIEWCGSKYYILMRHIDKHLYATHTYIHASASHPKTFHSARERRLCLTRSASGDAPADGRVLLGEKDTMRTRCIGWRARGEEQPPREVGRACGRPAQARIGHRDLFGRTPPPRPLASPLPRPLPSRGASWVPCTQGAQWGSQSMSVAGLESVRAGGIGGEER